MNKGLSAAIIAVFFSLNAGAAASKGFDKTVSLQGITFHIQANTTRPENTVSIKPKGLKTDNRAIKKTVFGSVTQAEVADLNADGSPEIYVFYTTDSSGSYGGLLAYAANANKSLSEIYLPDLLEDKKASDGYMGHDEFSIVENRLGRRFPVYRPGDINSKPTGGTRTLYYKLVKGEAGWILKLDQVVNAAPAGK